jgi:eukaryotic-like serine/threonine-protein kinase
MSEEPAKKAPPAAPPRPRGTDSASTAVGLSSGRAEPPPPPSARSSGLKVVTVLPGSLSIPDTDAKELLKNDIKPPPAKRDPYLGCTIDGRYKVEAVLGEGGMGVVYRCSHKIIGKKVAMKVLRADLARDKEVTERFLNEAKAASAIGNPHIIDISDFGELPDGSTYFVMEYLDGVPLSKIVEGGKAVPVSRILHIARQLGEGLSAAHHASIVHRDLKPDNIYLVARGGEKDFVKVLDFGIAKVSSGEGKLTRAGAVFGTPHYMSPEQAAGAPVDHRGDIYSFGVILYELASGKVPFDADNFMGILTQHMYKAPVPIRALVPQPQDVPPGLEAVVLKCLSKRPEQRYQSMDELIIELDKLKDGLIPDAVPEMMSRSGGFNVPADYFKKVARMPEPVPATPAGVRRSRWPLFAGVAGVCAAIGIVVAIFAKSAESTASLPSATAPASNARATAERADPAPSESASTAVTPVTAPPNTKQVALAIEPLDAHVFEGDKDLGASPVLIHVPDGSTVQLEVRHEGYRTEKITLDGSKTKELVKLTPVRTYHPVAKPKPHHGSTTSKPSFGGGEIVNPWAH